MICGSEHFYKECLGRACPKCGAAVGEPCVGPPWLMYYAYMQRPPCGIQDLIVSRPYPRERKYIRRKSARSQPIL